MLGRGLESLIPNKSKQTEQNDVSPTIIAAEPIPAALSPAKKNERTEAVYHIEVDKITPNPFQPRRSFDSNTLQELAASIREFGLLQPLIVSKIEKETDRGTDVEYQLIAGERRLQAAKLLRLERVPVIIRAMSPDQEKLEMAIIENVQRENLGPVEAARAYAKLQDRFGLTQREIASKIGKSRETVANVLRLLNLPSHIQNSLAENKISESQARLLLTIADQSRQEELFQDIINNNTSVRDLKRKLARLNHKDNPSPVARLAVAQESITSSATASPKFFDPEMAALLDSLEESIGIKIDIEKNPTTGEIKLIFPSTEELQLLLEKIISRD